jgi:hypothetical protein
MVSEDSESSESENEDNDLSYEIKKLKTEADQGDQLSKKIWKRIDKRMVKKLAYIIRK